MPDQPIDRNHLARYTQGDSAFENEILSLFRSQMSVYLNGLVQAESLKDWQEQAHGLKGMARSAGAFPLAELGEQAEQLSELHGPAHRALLHALEKAAADVARYIGSCLDDGVSP